MSKQKNGPLPQPSRLALNTGILAGGLVGLAVTQSQSMDNTASFIFTAVCCMIGAAIFSYADVFWKRRKK